MLTTQLCLKLPFCVNVYHHVLKEINILDEVEVPCMAYPDLIPHSPPAMVTSILNWEFLSTLVFYLHCICAAKPKQNS